MDRDRDERIRERAHEIWEREGRQEGSHDAHWERAERELAEEEHDGGAEPSDGTARQRADQVSAGGAARRKR